MFLLCPFSVYFLFPLTKRVFSLFSFTFYIKLSGFVSVTYYCMNYQQFFLCPLTTFIISVFLWLFTAILLAGRWRRFGDACWRDSFTLRYICHYPYGDHVVVWLGLPAHDMQCVLLQTETLTPNVRIDYQTHFPRNWICRVCLVMRVLVRVYWTVCGNVPDQVGCPRDWISRLWSANKEYLTRHKFNDWPTGCF